VSLRLPRPRHAERWALFLDFDGTLTEIVDVPDRVHVPPALRATLGELVEALDGALAIISGRPITDLDQYFAPLRLPVAGLHGLEWRTVDGRVQRRKDAGGALDDLRKQLEGLASADGRLLVEDKSLTVALHYRGAAEREAELRALMSDMMEHLDGYHLLCGKMVIEVVPVKTGKGRAIEIYMRQPPFRGCRAVFAGDDVTDEDGFAAVARMGGICIKVGDGPSRATYRASTVGAFVAWLQELPRHLRADGSGQC